MQQVGEQQFLVLLLVLQAQLHQGQHLGGKIPAGQQFLHARIDGCAVAQHLRQAGPADQAALVPRVLRPHAVVVAVEQFAVGRVKESEAGLMGLQNHCSKNQVLCARCHLAGLASGMDCSWQSSALKPSIRSRLC